MDMLDDTVGAIDEDIVVTTTIDPKMQAHAEHALTDELNAKGAKYGVGQGALVALDPERRRQGDGRRDAITPTASSIAPSPPSASRAPPSSRSSIWPRWRRGLTPDTVREDAPITVKGWNPENYSREYFGPVTLTKALVAVAEHGRGAARARSRAEDGGQDRPSPRHRLRPRPERLDRARHFRGDAARNGLPPTPPSPMAASACSRM